MHGDESAAVEDEVGNKLNRVCETTYQVGEDTKLFSAEIRFVAVSRKMVCLSDRCSGIQYNQ